MLRSGSSGESVKWNPEDITRMAEQHFLEDNTVYDFLSCREPSCVFDNSKYLPVVSDEFNFVSLVVSSNRHSHVTAE